MRTRLKEGMGKGYDGPVHICSRYRYPMHLFSEEVLGTYAFRLRDHWIVLGTIAFRFVIGTIHGLRSLTSMHYTAQRENSLVGMIDRLTLGHNARSLQLCTKSRSLEHVLGTTAFRLRFGGVLRGWFVPKTWFDHVPAGTVLAGTVPARTRSDYKKWYMYVPRTCSENMFQREQVWMPGIWQARSGHVLDTVHHEVGAQITGLTAAKSPLQGHPIDLMVSLKDTI